MEITLAVSVIVAVYNAEKYIHRCLDSILAQTFTDFEVLLIDDGSTDKSGSICDEYARMDARFRVIHKENGGVSSARQCGVDNALGEYSIHIDPDDWVEPDYLEAMYDKIIEDDADICLCQYIVEYENCKKYYSFTKNSFNGHDDSIDKLLTKIPDELWNKLVRHDLYRKYDIKFPQSLSMGEDAYVVLRIILSHPKITFVNKYLYHYDKCMNLDSITNSYNIKTFKNQEEYVKLISELESVEWLINYRKSKITRMAHSAFYYNVLNQKEYTKHFMKHIFIILSSPESVHKKLNITLSLLGLKWLVRPIYIFMKKKLYTHD